MKPDIVVVETNWVVDIIAPAHLQGSQALKLLESAQAGEFQLHVPAICFAEARETVPRRFAPKSRSENFRKFVRWARDTGRVTAEDSSIAFRIFDQFDGWVGDELTKVPERLDILANDSSLNVFPLSEKMLERQVSIGSMNLSLKPFDLAILAAVIVKSEELLQEGYPWTCFCELDSDLQPWDKSGFRKPILSELYENAKILVRGDFLIEEINDLPDGW